MNRTWFRLTVGVFMAFVVSSAFAQGKGEVPDSLFDKAVEFIKRAEGWHRGQMPYIGYGHCLLPGETLTENLSKAQADSLLRSDLRKCCDAFREFENDALLLGVLSYNVGIFRLKGHGRIPKSRLIRKLEKGERDIYEEYVSFRCYKGKVISIYLDYKKSRERRWGNRCSRLFLLQFLLIFKSVYTAGYSNLCFRLK